MAGNVQNISDSQFEEVVLKSNKLVLVDFWAEWCGPCRGLAPKLEEIATEMPDKVSVMKVNVDENRDYAMKYGVRGIPTMILFKAGQQVEQISGNVAKDLIVNAVNKHL